MAEKRPRVLILYDFPLHGGGSGAYVKYLSLRLVEAYKYELGVCMPDEEIIHPGIANFPLNLSQIPVYVGRPGLETQKKYSDLTPKEIADLYKAYIDGTIRAVQAFKPDIIHVHHIMINA